MLSNLYMPQLDRFGFVWGWNEESCSLGLQQALDTNLFSLDVVVGKTDFCIEVGLAKAGFLVGIPTSRQKSMADEMNNNGENYEGVDEIDASEDANVNEGYEFDFEEIDFGSLNEYEVKKYREGFRDKKNELVRKRAPIKETRCGCLARMKIHIDKEKCDWYVSYFVDDHNHELVGEHYGGMIASNRSMTQTYVAQMNTMREVGIGTGKIFSSFAGQAGGYGYIGFFKKDMYNQIQRQRRIGNAFDATYGRNKYKFSVVIFSCVNHHKKTTVFATGIVSNETEEIYVWLLGNFLEAMNGKHPKCVITDGDLSMKNAIKRVFPTAHHRLCAWHIRNNAGKKIKNNNFHKDFQKVMYADVEIDDFNMMWEELILSMDFVIMFGHLRYLIPEVCGLGHTFEESSMLVCIRHHVARDYIHKWGDI
ncbi:hypothetical protein Lal_00024372 [Lupinus albus]|nr:hypothetical protein Lal_00024372 [Lupinus albus]